MSEHDNNLDPDNEQGPETSTQPEPAAAATSTRRVKRPPNAMERFTAPFAAALGAGVAVIAGMFMSSAEPPNDSTAEPVSGKQPAIERLAQSSPTSESDGLAQPDFLPPRPSTNRLAIAPEIVVKFAGPHKEKIQTICETFWRDKDAARVQFDAWKADKPAIRALSLKRATYSDELVLVLDRPTDGLQLQDVRDLYRDATEKLRSDPGVRYAEPNATAQPGKGDE